MAPRKPKNPINDIINTTSAWLGGNRGSIPSSGAGAAWQASARSAAQSANTKIVKGLGEVPVQLGALGMGTSAQTQRDLMYGVPGAGTQAAKEAAVSYVTGAAVGYGVGKVATKLVQSGRVGNPVAAAVNRVTGKTVMVHGSPVPNLKQISPRSGSNMAPDESVVFGWNPRARNAKTDIPQNVQQYMYKEGMSSGPGSAYVVKVPKSSSKVRHDILPQIMTSSEPAKVVSEVSGARLDNAADFQQQIQKQLRIAGVRPKGETFWGDLENNKKLAMKLRAQQAVRKIKKKNINRGVS